MVLPMTNSDQKTPSADAASHTDERSWRQLSENILTLAVRKSDRMIDDRSGDDDAFDRDARDLRLLMGSAEIAARMNRQHEKERRPNDEAPPPREHTEEELNDIFRNVVARIDRLDADERARAAVPPSPDTGQDAPRNIAGRSGHGVADQCA